MDPGLSKKDLSDLSATATPARSFTGFWGSKESRVIFPEKSFNTVPLEKDLSDPRPTSVYQVSGRVQAYLTHLASQDVPGKMAARKL